MKPNTAIFFRHRPIGMYTISILCIMFAFVCGGMVTDAILKPFSKTDQLFENKWIIVFIGLIAFIMLNITAFHFLAQARITRLVISPEGLQYHAHGYVIMAAWESVKSIHRNKKYRFGTGLYLDNPTVIVRSPKFLFRPHAPHDQNIGLLQFNLNWEQDEIGLYLRKYVPELFESKYDK